jgi:hypothetical protein
MTSWKLVLGAGAACAACCAAPILSGVAALGIGSGLFAGAAGAFSAFTGSWVPAVAAGIALAVVAGVFAWRRRRITEPAAGCGCPGRAGAAPACSTTRS